MIPFQYKQVYSKTISTTAFMSHIKRPTQDSVSIIYYTAHKAVPRAAHSSATVVTGSSSVINAHRSAASFSVSIITINPCNPPATRHSVLRPAQNCPRKPHGLPLRNTALSRCKCCLVIQPSHPRCCAPLPATSAGRQLPAGQTSPIRKIGPGVTPPWFRP
jgi:hypothetical protein